MKFYSFRLLVACIVFANLSLGEKGLWKYRMSLVLFINIIRGSKEQEQEEQQEALNGEEPWKTSSEFQEIRQQDPPKNEWVDNYTAREEALKKLFRQLEKEKDNGKEKEDQESMKERLQKSLEHLQNEKDIPPYELEAILKLLEKNEQFQAVSNISGSGSGEVSQIPNTAGDSNELHEQLNKEEVSNQVSANSFEGLLQKCEGQLLQEKNLKKDSEEALKNCNDQLLIERNLKQYSGEAAAKPRSGLEDLLDLAKNWLIYFAFTFLELLVLRRYFQFPNFRLFQGIARLASFLFSLFIGIPFKILSSCVNNMKKRLLSARRRQLQQIMNADIWVQQGRLVMAIEINSQNVLKAWERS